MEKPTVFISYKREKSYIVNKLEGEIGGRAEIKRDTKEIGAWESITTFMNNIRKQDFAILVISDNYLKSVACMYEVLQLLRDDDWLDKTLIMFGEEVNIFGLTEQLNYIAYWNEEYTKLSDMIKQLPPESVSAQAEELKKIARIKDEIGSFLHIVSDRNIPVEDVYTQINLRLKQFNVVDKDNSTETVRLGSDAIALLITTCNASGMLCISSTLDSYSISIDNTNFVECSSLDNRTIARWKEVISKLESYELVETNNNFLYRVTQSGYKASDDLEKQIGSEKIKCNNCNYHGATDKKNECPICEHKTSGKENLVLDAIIKNPCITRRMLAELLGYSEKTIERLLKNMIEKGIIERVGSSKTGRWKIK